MTATRDRRSDPEQDAEPAWDERSILGKSRGLPWWGAVLLAFGLAAIAAAFDMQRQDSLGRVYQGAYLVGCVAAICLVRRRSLFGPMVQPPLVFAVTAVAAVLLLAPDTGGGGGVKSLIFSVALPLTSNFPTMAITTGLTVAAGLFRWYRERDPAVAGSSAVGRKRPGKDRIAPARGRRGEPEAAADVDAADEARPRRRGAPEPGASRRGDRRGTPETRRGEAPRRGGSRRDPEDPRRGRRGDDGRTKSDRPSRPRPDADLDAEPRRGLRGRSARDARPEQGARERAAGSGDRDRARSRDRDAAQPRRREANSERPRRDDRSRREAGERSATARRRPQDP
ncbi:MAG TPA: DUF6542 domain-containing protein [Actinophytocola sp.]|nr:DUF6542 domain-containing protein [Actinophytocola sp.]